MKQLLLATALFVTPVVLFTGFHLVTASSAAVTSGLGDLSSFKTIVADFQARADAGDMAGTVTSANDWESAWDHGQTAIRPLSPEYWGNIDAASDAALSAVRATPPQPAEIKTALAALMASLDDPTKPVQ